MLPARCRAPWPQRHPGTGLTHQVRADLALQLCPSAPNGIHDDYLQPLWLDERSADVEGCPANLEKSIVLGRSLSLAREAAPQGAFLWVCK